MQYFAMSLLLAWTALGVSLPLAAAEVVSPSQLSPRSAISVAPLSVSEKEYGVKEETPNQRRRREGQPIVASFPPPEYGELLETPNQRRTRMGIPLPGEKDPGRAEET